MRKTTKKNYHERILRVLQYIQHNIDGKISLNELADIANFSPFHFHRVFKGMIGETLAEHTRRLRLERAANRLAQTQHSITYLAFETGYETVESFIRAFKARFKVAPSEYRKLKSPEQIEIKEKYAMINYQSLNKKGDKCIMEVKIVQQPERRVAFVRHVGPYNECCKAWQTLCSWAGPKGLLNKNTHNLGLCYDDPEVTPPEKVRYDACITVDDSIQPDGEIGIQNIEAGEYAVFLHQGPYENLSKTYASLCGEWLPNSGRELKNAPSVEEYLNDPNTTPPEKLLVEIQMPLEQ